MIERSVITCPSCGFTKSEAMPTDAFYACEGCGTMLRPKPGDLLRFLLLRLRSMPIDAGGSVRRSARWKPQQRPNAGRWHQYQYCPDPTEATVTAAASNLWRWPPLRICQRSH